MLRGDAFQDRAVDLLVNITRQERVEHPRRARLEDHIGQRRGVLGRLDRQQLLQFRPLIQRADEARVDQEDRVDLARNEVVHRDLGNRRDLVEVLELLIAVNSATTSRR